MKTQFNPSHFAYFSGPSAYVSFPDRSRREAAYTKLLRAGKLAWFCRVNGDGRFWLGLQLRPTFN